MQWVHAVNDARLQHNLRLLHTNSSGSPLMWSVWRAAGEPRHRDVFPIQPPFKSTNNEQMTDVQHALQAPLSSLPALCASPKRTSVMLLGSLWDLPRCNTQSSSSPSDDAMVNRKAQCKTERRDQRLPRSSASSGGADWMWLDCCRCCSSWSPIRSSAAGEIHYARSIMPPSSAARKPPTLKKSKFAFTSQFLLVKKN